MHKFILIFCVAFSIAAGFSNSTLAAVVVQNQSFFTSKIVNNSVNPVFVRDDMGSNISKSFSLFDTSLGNLESVNIEIDFDVTSSFGATFFDNFLPKNAAGNQRTSQTSIRFSTQNFSQTKSLSTLSDSCSDSPSGFDFGPAVCTTNVTNGIHSASGGSSISQTLMATSSLIAFSGTGNFLFDVDLRGDLITDASAGNLTGRSGTYGSTGNIAITYTYSAVPLPAGAWLFSSALVGLIGLRTAKK